VQARGTDAGIEQSRAPAFTQARVSPATGFGLSNIVAEARRCRRSFLSPGTWERERALYAQDCVNLAGRLMHKKKSFCFNV
jgi:hypothetical protein